MVATDSNACLKDITPEDVCRYFNHCAYGEEHPSDASRPEFERSHTIKDKKKMISFFMPCKNFPWNDVDRKGNPTRAQSVNDLIKRIMKYEVRQQGVKSQARRPIEFAEFLNALTIIRTNSNLNAVDQCRLSSILTLQWQHIGRIEDIMKLQYCNFSFNPCHNFTLICQMRWSKNICEERESPHQILLASMDDRLCVILNLALFVEIVWSGNRKVKDLKFVYGNGENCDRSVRQQLQCILENTAFKKLIQGNLGTHSIRKGPATYASRNGISRENIEYRGRWRTYKRQVDTYIDNNRPLPDAQVAGCLCGPSGAIMYSVKDSNWCTDSFLSEKIAPNCSKVSPQVGALFGEALMYAAIQKTSQMDPHFILLPDSLRLKILRSIQVAGNYEEQDDIPQLVTRVPIAIRGLGDELIFDPASNVNASSINEGSSTLAMFSELKSLSTAIMVMKRRIEEIEVNRHNEMIDQNRHWEKRYNNLHCIVKRIASFPARSTNIQPVEQPTSNELQRKCMLSKRPRDLYELWHEYEFGLGGLKPAKDFISAERGSCKWKYCARLVFWNLVTGLINRNHTSLTAIDAVYSAYGRSCSVTQILRQLRKDKSLGHFRNLLS